MWVFLALLSALLSALGSAGTSLALKRAVALGGVVLGERGAAGTRLVGAVLVTAGAALVAMMG